MNTTEKVEQNELERLRSVNAELLAALKRLRKFVLGLVWNPIGETGDASDWFQCELCGSRGRDTRSLSHVPDCPMYQAEAVIRKAEGQS